MREMLLALLHKDLRLITRRKLLLAALALYPFIFMGILGLTFSGGRRIVLGVVVPAEDEGQRIWVEGEPLNAREMMEKYAVVNADLHYFESREAAIDRLRRHLVDAVLIIPDGFLAYLKTLDSTVKVIAVVDESNPWAAASGESALRSALSRINRTVVEEKMRAVNAGLQVLVTGGDFFGSEIIGLEKVIEDLEEVRDAVESPHLRDRLEEELELARTVVDDLGDASAYLRGTALPLDLEVVGISGRILRLDSGLLPLLLGLSTLWTGILCAASLMSMEETSGMRRRLRVAGSPEYLILSSKVAVAAFIVATQSLLMSIAAVLIAGVPAAGIVPVMIITFATSLSSIGIGTIIAAFSRETYGAVILAVLVSLPLIFLSGAVFPLGQMPGFLRSMARFLPFTWAFEAMGGAMLGGDSIGETLWRSAVILSMGLLLLSVGVIAMRRGE